MGYNKRKTVFNAGARAMDTVQALVDEGRYRSASEFIREAIEEKLERMRRMRVAEQVARYCADGHANEDAGLIDSQALDGNEEPE